MSHKGSSTCDLRSSLLSTISPTVPIPASAAPGPPSPKTGMIQVVDPSNPGVKAYLSRTLYTGTYIVNSANVSDALIVEYDSYRSPRTLKTKV